MNNMIKYKDKDIGTLSFIERLENILRTISKIFGNGHFRIFRKILFPILITFFISPAFAGVYKWKDTNGQIHYDDAIPMKDTIKNSVEKIDREVNKSERPERAERPDTIDRPEKVERPERSERPGN